MERGLGPYDRSVRILLGLIPAPGLGCDRRRGFKFGEALLMRAFRCEQREEHPSTLTSTGNLAISVSRHRQ